MREHWTLDPTVTYLNHGSYGACPRPVLERQSELRARLEREPVQFFATELEPLLDASRAALAAFVGADPADLVFVNNATTAVSTVLRSLSFAPDDEILTTDHAYNACRNALDRSGARVVVADVPFPISGPGEVVAAVIARVGPKTRLALIDHVTSPTALVFPVAELVRALAERGVDTLVDGAHAPGMVELDLGALGAAWYTGNCHKWLCAPKGAAFLHARRERQDGLRPLVTSHGANTVRPERSRFHLEFDWVGTDDPTAILCVADALRFIGERVPGGWPEVRARNHAAVVEARRRLCTALAIDAPCPEAMLGSMATLPIPDGADVRHAVDPLQRALYERCRIEVPIMPWPAPPRRLLRISMQLYNDPAEADTLARALSMLGWQPGV